jgi:hypothetical protein
MKASAFLENLFKSLNGKKKLSNDRKTKSLNRLVLTLNAEYFAYTYKNARNANEILPKAIDYLGTEVQNTAQFFNDKTGLFAFYFVGKMLAYEANSIDESLFENTNFLSFLSNVITFLNGERHTLDFSSQLTNIYTPEQVPSLNELKVMLFKYTVFVTNQVLLMSVTACKLYMEIKSGVRAHLGFLNDEFFVQVNSERTLIMWDQKENLLIEFLLQNLTSLSKYSEEYVQIWTELNACDTFLKIARLKPNLEFLAYNAMTNVANDREIETIGEFGTFSRKLVDLLSKFSDAVSGENTVRATRRVTENNMTLTTEVVIIELADTNVTNSLASVMQSLYKLALNQKFRPELYWILNAREHLKSILKNGNHFEIKLAARVLAQLSFENDIAVDLDNDQEYTEFIDDILLNEASPSSRDSFQVETEELCRQIVWNVSEAKGVQTTTGETDTDLSDHIVISYEPSSRDTCLRIKSLFQSHGYAVSAEENFNRAGNLTQMAYNLENSCCVLVLVTEKYRQSVYCQAEGLYAKKLDKPIIPLILQTSYERVGGWLGQIIADKAVLDLIDYGAESYEDNSLSRLREEVDNYYTEWQVPNLAQLAFEAVNSRPQQAPNVSQPQISNNINSSIQGSISQPNVSSSLSSNLIPSIVAAPRRVERKNPALAWDCDKVHEWFEENEINMEILSVLRPCDGELLGEVNQVRQRAPEYFFARFDRATEGDLRSVVKFSAALAKLFAAKQSNFA